MNCRSECRSNGLFTPTNACALVPATRGAGTPGYFGVLASSQSSRMM